MRGIFVLTLVTAAILEHNPLLPVKRSEGTVAGAENGTSYYYKLTATSAQCPSLLVADLQTSLGEFDGLFPPELVQLASPAGNAANLPTDTMPAVKVLGISVLCT